MAAAAGGRLRQRVGGAKQRANRRPGLTLAPQRSDLSARACVWRQAMAAALGGGPPAAASGRAATVPRRPIPDSAAHRLGLGEPSIHFQLKKLKSCGAGGRWQRLMWSAVHVQSQTSGHATRAQLLHSRPQPGTPHLARGPVDAPAAAVHLQPIQLFPGALRVARPAVRGTQVQAAARRRQSSGSQRSSRALNVQGAAAQEHARAGAAAGQGGRTIDGGVALACTRQRGGRRAGALRGLVVGGGGGRGCCAGRPPPSPDVARSTPARRRPWPPNTPSPPVYR